MQLLMLHEQQAREESCTSKMASSLRSTRAEVWHACQPQRNKSEKGKTKGDHQIDDPHAITPTPPYTFQVALPTSILNTQPTEWLAGMGPTACAPRAVANCALRL